MLTSNRNGSELNERKVKVKQTGKGLFDRDGPYINNRKCHAKREA